jgi:hypothetical protein
VPDFLTLLARHNAAHGITATFSEMKKTARSIAKAYEARPDSTVDPDAYVLQYWDETGETAVENVLTEQNRTNAARRTAAA